VADEQNPLQVIVFQGVQNLPLFAAQARGFFKEYDLNVEMKITPNSNEMREGLAQGRYHIAHGAVDNAVAMVELAKEDVVVVMGGDHGFNKLFVQPHIAGYEDLRGKAVIVDAPNTAFALIVYEMLERNGIRRGDYVIKPVGSTPLRLEAMQKDQSAATAMLNLPFSIVAERSGLKSLADVQDVIGPYLSTAGFVLRAWGEQNTQVLVRYIKAYVQGLRWVLDSRNRSDVIDLLAERLRLTPEIAAESYAVVVDPQNGFARDATLDMAGFENVLEIRAKIEGQWNGSPPAAERYIDLSYYKQAVQAL
jgi:ABC-type nitrate/sulfonate/bicarbonate transport system substrate-binding protein